MDGWKPITLACAMAAALLGAAVAPACADAPALPKVTNGPPVDQVPSSGAAPPAAETPAQPSQAMSTTCMAVLMLAHYTRYCQLKEPAPVGARCRCPYGPPPPGIAPAPPDQGFVIR